MIVIDVGCARYGGAESMPYLMREFEPEVLYGFDPSDNIIEVVKHDWKRFQPLSYYLTPEGCTVYLRKEAAWIFDGTIPFNGEGISGRIGRNGPDVPCIDLAKFIRSLPVDKEIALKIDAEGSEYELLEHLIDTGTDELLKLAWVEWHPPRSEVNSGLVNSRPDERRDSIERRIRCEMHQWNL